ncbi:MAG TPA: response regulator [Myxococcales bacterium]|nr:response regulator [Myxococcales bacterium]
MPQPRILVVDDNPELLALLSSAFEEAGYAVQTALRGRNALDLAKREKPDLAVLDVLLPDLMGFDVAEALKKLRVPFIFMSGVHKGGKAAANATGKYGALGYFEKPFDRSALLAMVEQIVPSKPAQGGKAEAWDVDAGDRIEGAADNMELTGRIDLISKGTTASFRGEKVTLKGAEANPIAGLQLGREPARKPPKPPMLRQATFGQPRVVPPPLTPEQEAEQRQDAEALEVALSRASVSGAGGQTSPPSAEALQQLPQQKGGVHRGILKNNLPQLFAAFAATRETGELGLARGQVKKIVYFEQGMPVFALSNLVADRLGQFLVRAGKIDESALKQAVAEATATQQRTGDVLILMGLLTEQDRLYYIGQQIKSILYSLFSWEDGTYQMSFSGRARKEAIKLDLHPSTLVIRGVKKLYKPERMRRLLPDAAKLIPSQDPLFALSDVELASWEAHLLTRCDGTRTVKELIDLAARPELDAMRTLVALFAMHIVERTDA